MAPPDTASTASTVVPLRAERRRWMVLIPALDEQGRVGDVVRGVRRLHPDAAVVVVDDGSRDGTAAEARRAGAEVITHPYQMGYGAALQTGYKFALRRDAEWVVQMDGDGQHRPSEIRHLLRRLDRGDVDLVIGSRFLGRGRYRMPPARRAGSRLFAAMTSAILRRRVTDPTSGFQALNARTLRFYRRDHYPLDFPDADTLVRAVHQGLRVGEVPVEMLPGVAGKSMHRGWAPVAYVPRAVLELSRAWLTGRPTRQEQPDRIKNLAQEVALLRKQLDELQGDERR